MITLDAITTFAATGAAGLALTALAEKLIPIVPSYVLLVLLGMTVVTDTPSLASAIVATTIGSTVASACWYGLGRAIGTERIDALVLRFGRYVFLSHALYQRMSGAYRRNQFGVTLIGQLIPTVRIYMALPAGVLRLEPSGFLLATCVGASVWNAFFLTLGYALRDSGRDPVSLGVMLITGLVLCELALFFGFYSRFRARR